MDVQLEDIEHPADDPLENPTDQPSSPPEQASSTTEAEPLYDDPSADEEDGEGEWITPSNVALHKSRALHLLPDDTKGAKKGKGEQIKAGCMTADFAMQNVLLQMGLNLVSVDGKKIDRVKTWVLRCHACFKCVSSCSLNFVQSQNF